MLSFRLRPNTARLPTMSWLLAGANKWPFRDGPRTGQRSAPQGAMRASMKVACRRVKPARRWLSSKRIGPFSSSLMQTPSICSVPTGSITSAPLARAIAAIRSFSGPCLRRKVSTVSVLPASVRIPGGVRVARAASGLRARQARRRRSVLLPRGSCRAREDHPATGPAWSG